MYELSKEFEKFSIEQLRELEKEILGRARLQRIQREIALREYLAKHPELADETG